MNFEILFFFVYMKIARDKIRFLNIFTESSPVVAPFVGFFTLAELTTRLEFRCKNVETCFIIWS